MDPEYWNGEAGRAWAEGAPTMDRILLPFAVALLDAAAMPPTGTVVDVGCGCGATTLMLAERFPAATVIGLDVSRPMLEVARSRAAGLERLRFVEEDAATGCPPSTPVDRVVSRFGMMFFADPPRAFANVRGWVRPGGTLTAVVWNRLSANPWLHDLVQIVGRHTPHVWAPGDGPGPFSLGDPKRTHGILAEAGWTSITQVELGLPMRVEGDHDDVLDFCLHRGPVATALAEATEDARGAVIAELRSWIDARHDGTGATLEAGSRCITAVAP